MNKTILYAEDSALARNVLKEFLQDRCKNLVIAGDGREGLEKFTECNPDLVITDIKMPHLEGFDMIGRIREIDATVPIIIISAYGAKEDRERADRLGVHTFLQKPLDLDALDDLITKILGQDD